LIVASHRMSRIDPRRPRGPSLQSLQHLRQDAGIQELREHRQDLYEQIRDRILNEKGRALKATWSLSLCTRQERPRKPRQSWKYNTATSSSDDDTPDVDIKLECSDYAPLGCQFPLQCRPFQCLYCLSDAALCLRERQHIFCSNHSLQRHFNQHHHFQPGQNCPFPNDECGQLALKSLHAAEVYVIASIRHLSFKGIMISIRAIFNHCPTASAA